MVEIGGACLSMRLNEGTQLTQTQEMYGDVATGQGNVKKDEVKGSSAARIHCTLDDRTIDRTTVESSK